MGTPAPERGLPVPSDQDTATCRCFLEGPPGPVTGSTTWDRDMALPLVEEVAWAGVRCSILPAVPSTAAGAHIMTETVLWRAFCRVCATLPRRPCGPGRAAPW